MEDYKKAAFKDSDDPVHVGAADAMILMLKGEAGPEDTAKRITKIYETELKSNNESPDMNYEEQVNYFWTYLLCSAIFMFDSAEQHERLFDLLVAISKQPDVKTPNGSVKKYCGRAVYWRDLPGWSLAFATQATCASTLPVLLITLLTCTYQTTMTVSSGDPSGRMTFSAKLHVS